MNTIKELIRHASRKTVPAEFSGTLADIEGALREEIRKLVGNYNLYRRNKLELFELLQEAIDDVVPNKVSAAMGMFAEVRQFNQGDRPVFRVGGLGKQRAKQFITKASPSGTYETFRLDASSFEVSIESYGGGCYVDFERYLDGLDNIMDLYDIVIDGLSEKVYELVQNLLLASWDSTRPTANLVQASYFDADLMVDLCNVVAAYGSPIIFCAPQFAATMHNGISYLTNKIVSGVNEGYEIPPQDVDEIRRVGHIGSFHGTPIVVLPQSFADETNTHFVINPRVAYVIPAGKERIVKVAFEGQTIVRDWENKGDNSMEIMVYKKMGAAIITPLHYWGMYENTGITATGWAGLTTL